MVGKWFVLRLLDEGKMRHHGDKREEPGVELRSVLSLSRLPIHRPIFEALNVF